MICFSIAILEMLNIMESDGGRTRVVICVPQKKPGCAFVDPAASGAQNHPSGFQYYFPKVLPAGNPLRINQ